MTAEERLAALLRDEADTIVPAGDGLQRIQKRVAAKRRSRWVLPSSMVATAAAASLFFVLGDADGPTKLTQTPQTHGPSVTTGPTSEPTPTQTVTGGGLDHPLEDPAIWPFTSSQEIAAWKTTHPYADDKTALVQHYLKDVLQLPSTFALSKPCESCDVVDIAVGGTKVAEAALERFLLDGQHVYTISTIGGTDLKVLSPDLGAAVTSPTRVTGRITGVDENVSISLVTKGGAVLATAGAPAGSEVPWEATVTWSITDWTFGDLVLRTYSAKDGALNRLTVLPVMRDSTAVTSGPTFVGISGGRVDLFDATTGAFRKHLTFPKAPATDVEVATSQSTVLWVRSQPTGCSHSLLRLDSGTASTVVGAGAYKLAYPRISADGRTIAYQRIPCSGSADPAIVITGPSGTRVLTYPEGEPLIPDDVADDGALLFGVAYGDGGTLGLAAGATSFGEDSVVFRERSYPQCQVGQAVFDGDEVVAFESCGALSQQLVRFARDGKRLSTGKVLDMEAITHVSARDGVVLLTGNRRDDAPEGVFTTRGDALETLDTPSDVRSADW
jgi:hypothetical protein